MSVNGRVSAILVHVSDVPAALDWYAKAFPIAKRFKLDAFDFEYLLIGEICLEIVPSDNKVSSGKAGSIVYWSCDNFQQSLKYFLDNGAVLYRGPLAIQDGLEICQVLDPWGNCIGLRGPSH